MYHVEKHRADIPLIFPINTEDTFLELHTLSHLFEVLELARYVGNSISVKESLKKQIQEPNPPELFFTEKERHCIFKLN